MTLSSLLIFALLFCALVAFGALFFLRGVIAELLAPFFGRKRKTVVDRRPHRSVELAQPFDAAYDRVMDAVVTVLGAHVTVDDRKTRFIEVAFGIVNNERVRIAFETPDSSRTIVSMTAIFPAGSTIPEKSPAVEALAKALTPS